MFVIYSVLTVVFPGSDFMERIIFLRLGVGENLYGVPAHKFRVAARGRGVGTAGAAVRTGPEFSRHRVLVLSPQRHVPQQVVLALTDRDEGAPGGAGGRGGRGLLAGGQGGDAGPQWQTGGPQTSQTEFPVDRRDGAET